MDAKHIEREALHLPLPARAALARRLLASLESPNESELEALWLDEAARRARQIDGNEVRPIPGDTVEARARALLR